VERRCDGERGGPETYTEQIVHLILMGWFQTGGGSVSGHGAIALGAGGLVLDRLHGEEEEEGRRGW
jgi:hypothetical protein